MKIAHDAHTPTTEAAAEVVWTPCPTCWGQRRIYDDPNGEGLVPCLCPTCLGIGERPGRVD
jgi:hypothetical protein